VSAVTRRQHLQGLSLVEVMVSLVIGVVVAGAVLVSYIGSGKTGRQQAAYAEMTENAQLALTLMSRDLLLAGFAAPTGLAVGGASFTRAHAERPVFGCQTGFVTPNTVGAVACAADGADAIEVVYAADTANTVPTAADLPTDCLGNGLADAGGYYLAYNRYYLADSASGRPELHCASRQGAAGQPLVENVQAMTVWYGEANAVNPAAVVRYVRAGQVSDWGLVLSVRLCLLMRSSEAVLDAGEDTMTYLDCDSAQQVSADGLARRAFFSTTTLRNKMAF
jgi:type IV pilus assembly protein PilW